MGLPLQKIRLSLLAHSKKMLNASEQGLWDEYSALEAQWLPMLECARKDHGGSIEDLGSLLINDNEKIQQYIVKAQSEILSLLDKDVKNSVSIKSYLK